MKVFRSRIFTPIADPFPTGTDPVRTYRTFDDGYLAIDDAGRIAGVGAWSELPETLHSADPIELGSASLISPGFCDTHLHAPQLEMIGSYG
ncbi:MAG TPA: guanine deaminase, partial [Thermoanaerobaculia bacterium]|nr:guanine deaminase [Thermoanaerobaculia bacterium]